MKTRVLIFISEVVMRTGKWLEISLKIHVLLFFFTISALASTDEVPSYSEIKDAIDAAYEARSKLLYNSTGVAEMFFREPISAEENLEAYLNQVYELSVIDSNEFTNIRYAPRTTTWYTKGKKKRFDMVCPDSNDPQAILIESNRRTVTDTEKSIIYDLINKKAYRTTYPIPVFYNPNGQSISFDIHKLYKFHGKTVSKRLYSWFEKETKSKRTLQITKEMLGKIECVKIDCNSVYIDSSGAEREKMRLELWLAPDMSYSLVKAKSWNSRPPHRDFSLLESYDASYKESETHSGIWLLKTLIYVNNQSEYCETFKVVFRDTRVGIDIPDKTFTLEGLGVPPGTTIEDGRGVSEDLFAVRKDGTD